MTESLTKYSLEEVSKRNGENGSRVWIIIREKVIDVTDQLDGHPGGAELMMEYAGRDATKVYDDAGHSLETLRTLKSVTVGELADEDKQVAKAERTKPATRNTDRDQVPAQRSFLSIISCGTCG